MGISDRKACRIELCGDIYEAFGEIRLNYFFEPLFGEEVFLPMPFFPCGIVCDFSVACDNEEFASAKAINIRDISDFPTDKYISLENRGDGVLWLRLKGICAKNDLIVSVTVCTELMRHGQNLTLSLTSPEKYAKDCPISANLTVHGNVKRAVCPGNKVYEIISDGLCRISVSDTITPFFILDIFYEDAPDNRIIISRRPLQKNIGLCSFAPQLGAIRGKKRKFDISISFLKGNRSEIIASLASFLKCLKKDDAFRLSVGGCRPTEFMPATGKNIDLAIELACEAQNEDGLCTALGDWNSIVICNGAIWDNSFPLSGTPMLIFSDIFPTASTLENAIFIEKKLSELIIPVRFSAIFEKRLCPVLIEPIGGIKTELLWDSEKGLLANTACFCFALHDIIPPKGLRILNGRKHLVEEIEFSAPLTFPSLRVINVLYAAEVIKRKSSEVKKAKPQNRCLIRQEISDICLQNGIAMGDIALVCIANGEAIGLASPLPALNIPDEKYFREETYVDEEAVIDLILENQTVDGIIAEIAVSRPDQQILSTALCLMALYFCTGKKYADFATRSLNYLKMQNGYWAKTAVDLWEGKTIYKALLNEKLKMKIMGSHLYELAVIIIKNHGRNVK